MGGVKKLKEEAPKRLQKEGWQGVRKALSCTIRYGQQSYNLLLLLKLFLRLRIINAFIANTSGKYRVAIELYTDVVDFLEWGRKFWQHEPEEDRGVIFLPSFIRGVKRLLISALHDVCAVSNDTKHIA